MRLLVIYSIFVLFISLIPVEEPRILVGIPWDKIGHFFIYFIFAIITYKTFFKSLHPYLYVFVYNFSFGLIVEIIQYFLPYRTFEFKDLFFNSLGILVGLMFLRYFKLSLKLINE
ncbi:MAG: VanZ family protein [Candidatus Omnitrophica bacterium]|nr:VanZ family protein [Candidatus Omnitrophota bacterium]MCM8826024.1 VanZ family protein [Candidatus Omnitrophota bacterium]